MANSDFKAEYEYAKQIFHTDNPTDAEFKAACEEFAREYDNYLEVLHEQTHD